MTEQMYDLGVGSWFSSDEDSGPDVGISIGLGPISGINTMLYCGEAPDTHGWALVLYPQSGDRVVIAQNVQMEEGRMMIEAIETAMRTPRDNRDRDHDALNDRG